MKLQSRTKHSFIELKVDEIEETIFKSDQKRLQEMIDNLTDVIENLSKYLDEKGETNP